MPLDYSIDHAKRRITTVWSPPLEGSQLTAALEQQAADGAWSYGVLHDARSILAPPDTANNGPQLLEAVARLSKIHGPRGPVAIVAAAQTVGIAQAYAFKGSKTGTQQVQVFWNREDAETWLDALTPDADSGG